MARNNIPTPDEALAGMSRIGSPRQPMGQQGFAFNSPTSEGSPNTTSVAKKGAQAGDPTGSNKKNRKGIQYPLPAERTGAQYRITAKFPPHTSPAAGATQANGRIIGAGGVGQAGPFSQEQSVSRA